MILKGLLIPLCLAGFIHATYLVMKSFWLYPVVIDIQTIEPSEITIPAISFCNSNGLLPRRFCDLGALCLTAYLLRLVDSCETYSDTCGSKGGYATDYLGVTYDRVLNNITFTPEIMDSIKRPLSSYLTCKIISGDKERECNTKDYIVGSYYSTSNLFNLCYTLYSKLHRPHLQLEKLKKTDRILLNFYLDKTDRDRTLPLDLEMKPKYNYPVSTNLQFNVHSNILATSPFISGVTLLPGKRYEIKLKQEVKRLLPAPYQTNCTDYMSNWINRGGVGPLNALMLIEECKYNKSLQELGCVPFSVDYVHNDSVCPHCADCENKEKITIIEQECSKLLQQYNQPCEFTSMNMKIEEKIVYIEKEFVNLKTNKTETFSIRKRENDCATVGKSMTRRCQMMSVEIVFDDFKITNLSYNPKLESNDIVSAVGGYMGIYLGFSMTSSYGFILKIVNFVRKRRALKRAKNKTSLKTKKKRRDIWISKTKIHPFY